MTQAALPISASTPGLGIQVLGLYGPQSVSVSTGAASCTTSFTYEVVRLTSTVDCFIVFGTSPTATTSDHFLKADIVYDFRVSPGDKVSVIRSDTDGTLYISELC